MTTLKRNKANKNLTKKGFKKSDKTKHSFYHYYHNGKKTDIFTFMSRGVGSKEIDDSLISSMATQLKLTKQEFMDVVNCDISKESLLQIYLNRECI